MDLVSIILAFAAGIVGTTIGGVQAFVFTGLVGLAGMGVDAVLGPVSAAAGGSAIPFIGGVPFGFWFHPAMAFLGGAAAAAYARKMGYLESGKAAVGTALAGLKKPDVLIVGGITGAIGYVTMVLLTGSAFLGLKADGGATAIFPLSLIIKAIFDGGSIMGKVPEEIKADGGRFGGTFLACWAPQQRGGWQKVVISVGWALVSAYATFLLFQFPQTAGYAPFIGFFISATSLLLLLVGMDIPITHHITLPAGYAVLMLVTANGGSITGIPVETALIWGLGIGMAGAFLAEFLADCFYVYGDVHVDPPAMAIFVASLCTMTLFPAMGLDKAGIVVPLVIVAICLIVAMLGGSKKQAVS
ncbi:MAG: hypothetical protein ACOYU3_05015 [Bacillota bacterium]